MCVRACVYVCMRGGDIPQSPVAVDTNNVACVHTSHTVAVLYCGLVCLQISCEEEQFCRHTTGSCAPEELPQAWCLLVMTLVFVTTSSIMQ